MKPLLALLCLAAIGLCLLAQSSGPVSVTLLSPTNGATVSGIIPITVSASSTAAPLKRIEYWRDVTNLIATIYLAQPPQNVSITVK